MASRACRNVWHRGARVAAGLALAAALAAPAAAEPEAYRLTPGDMLRLTLPDGTPAIDAQIDIDGFLRVSGAGSFRIANLTLDEAEAHIAAEFRDAPLVVAPRATLSVLGYAPIFVTGDVRGPGRFDYSPQLTVAAALGLSGGASRLVGMDTMQIDRAQNALAAEAVSLNLQIAATAVRIARCEAQLEERAEVTLDDALRAAIPQPGAVPLDRLLAEETEVLANSTARARRLVALWDEENAGLGEQKRLIAQRVELQAQVVASVQAELRKIRDLMGRGLTVASELARAEQLQASAEARVLELEAALSGVERGQSDTARQREQFLRNSREELLTTLHEGRLKLEELRLRHATALREQAILGGGVLPALTDGSMADLSLTVIDGRSGAPRDGPVTLESRLRPGDTLLVRVRSPQEKGS